MVLDIVDKDLGHYNIDDEELLKVEFKNLNSKDEVWEVDAEDENALRIELLGELEKGETEF